MQTCLRICLVATILLGWLPCSVIAQIYLTSSNRDTIDRVDLDGTGFRTVIDLDRALGSADYSPQGIAIYGNRLYWTDNDQDGIYTASLDGKGVRKLIDLRSAFGSRHYHAEGIAVTEDMIYWTDSLFWGVFAAQRDGSNPRQLLQRPNGEQPLGILVDGNRLVWTEWGGASGVYSANLDGTGMRRLVLNYSLNGSIALAAGKLYWTVGEDWIYTAASDGTSPRELIDLQSALGGEAGIWAYGIAVHKSQLFWTDRGRHAVFTAGVDGRNPRKLFDILDPIYLAIASPPDPEIHVELNQDRVEIEFTGILQSSDDLETWSDVEPQPSSPYRVVPASRASFYRAR